jgi:hypothetical protein
MLTVPLGSLRNGGGGGGSGVGGGDDGVSPEPAIVSGLLWKREFPRRMISMIYCDLLFLDRFHTEYPNSQVK